MDDDWGEENVDGWDTTGDDDIWMDEPWESTNDGGSENNGEQIEIQERKKQYETIDPEQVRVRLENKIAEFGQMLNCSNPEDARLILQLYDWSSDRATSEYFMHEEEGQKLTRINAGIDASKDEEDEEMLDSEVEHECPICLDDFPPNEVASLTCGHNVCLGCWSDYIRNAAKKNTCFKLNCPYTDCAVAATTTRLRQIGVREESVALLEYQQEKYRLRNYVQSCKDLRSCRGPDCQLVQQLYVNKSELSDIRCNCGHIYCVQCAQEGHRPCPCAVAQAWMAKATSEAENMQWILARTKKCPKCRVPIEKNQGCNHMTCRNCRHEFCWLCKGAWKEHGNATGGFYKCNVYEAQQKEGNVSSEEKARADAKSELERYSFYFTRYDNHMRAISQMKQTMAQAEARMGELMSQYQWKPNEASFIRDASITIQDCRRLLAWTYPIGYYMAEKEQLRDLFHQYQKDLEVYTEHLHELAEQPLEVFKDHDKRSEVINYQRVTQKYQNNLISHIETDYSEINYDCRD